jgi:hypothetical protein
LREDSFALDEALANAARKRGGHHPRQPARAEQSSRSVVSVVDYEERAFCEGAVDAT